MGKTMKRLLVATLALLVLVSAMLPATLAEEETKILSNGSSKLTTYVGLKSVIKVYNKYGTALSSSNYKWKSSKTSVASISSSGVLTAKKKGSATITATNKKNSRDKCTMKVTVNQNKVNINISKPSASKVSYKTWDVFLKSVEIASPSKVVAEYYLCCNYPSNWKASKLYSFKDYIRAYNRTYNTYVDTIVNGYGSTVSGFKARYGRFVQTIKINFLGSAVANTNLKLSNYNMYYYPVGQLTTYK